ncbi:nuclear transport factor 2 family protein [Streptomyces sp. SS]|uniref:nuclear transport factor 2 family protein n=1 Tax=Streptomyces sp. SS TaxID=260742 RepID=UPI0002E56EEB|nr:nuclear transport factor 2 family protein [Streptomyces sp. SS]
MDLVTAAGIDHIRLVYDYLDAGDLDGCASLLHDAVIFELPGQPPARGRSEAVRAHVRHVLPAARHEVDHLLARDRTVIATGRRVPAPTAAVPDTADHRFVDVFTIAPDGMVRTCVRYYHAAP